MLDQARRTAVGEPLQDQHQFDQRTDESRATRRAFITDGAEQLLAARRPIRQGVSRALLATSLAAAIIVPSPPITMSRSACAAISLAEADDAPRRFCFIRSLTRMSMPRSAAHWVMRVASSTARGSLGLFMMPRRTGESSGSGLINVFAFRARPTR